MKKIMVNLNPRYPIYIGRNLLGSDYLVNACKKYASLVVIIVDQKVRDLYGKPMLALFKKNHIKAHLISFKGGEKNKTRETKEKLEDAMFELGCGRDTCIVAVGGGITTDIVGFVASTYCRGIPVIYVPTSLLAMVDASIGGKTGVDTRYGKNLIGTFYQPKAVFIDIDTLKTLPNKEFNNGLVELIKHAIIKDKKLFNYIIENARGIKKLDKKILEKIILISCQIKKAIVEHDEKDIGMRQLLNFGHTIGHALEQVSNYKLGHGEAVMLGIIAESYMALKLKLLSTDVFEKIKSIFGKCDIPMAKLNKTYSRPAIKKALMMDKKNVNQTPRFILIKNIGSMYVGSTGYTSVIPDEIINRGIDIIC